MQIAADVIANMCASTNSEKALGVIDAGDGKGYLSTRLSLEHGIKVLGVDYNPTNTLGALIRSEKLEVIKYPLHFPINSKEFVISPTQARSSFSVFGME